MSKDIFIAKSKKLEKLDDTMMQSLYEIGMYIGYWTDKYFCMRKSTPWIGRSLGV